MGARQPTSRRTPAFLEIKEAMAQWDEDSKQAEIRTGYAALERESDAASETAGPGAPGRAHRSENACWHFGQGSPWRPLKQFPGLI
jgi:hypothetical protein